MHPPAQTGNPAVSRDSCQYRNASACVKGQRVTNRSGTAVYDRLRWSKRFAGGFFICSGQGTENCLRGENQYENLRKCCCIEEARDYVDGILKTIEEKRNQQLGDCKSAYVVRKVQEYVRSHYSQSVTVEDMAAEIHFSANYIRTIFKEGTGQTILEYITDYRFEQACELLKNPKYKVKEVSMQVGYENVSYFCSVFTKRYGETPNEYRKKYL